MCSYVSVLSPLGDVLIVRKWQVNKTALPKFWYRTSSIDLLTPALLGLRQAGLLTDLLLYLLFSVGLLLSRRRKYVVIPSCGLLQTWTVPILTARLLAVWSTCLSLAGSCTVAYRYRWMNLDEPSLWLYVRQPAAAVFCLVQVKLWNVKREMWNVKRDVGHWWLLMALGDLINRPFYLWPAIWLLIATVALGLVLPPGMLLAVLVANEQCSMT